LTAPQGDAWQKRLQILPVGFFYVESEVRIYLLLVERSPEPWSNVAEIDLSVNVIFQGFGLRNAIKSTARSEWR